MKLIDKLNKLGITEDQCYFKSKENWSILFVDINKGDFNPRYPLKKSLGLNTIDSILNSEFNDFGTHRFLDDIIWKLGGEK